MYYPEYLPLVEYRSMLVIAAEYRTEYTGEE